MDKDTVVMHRRDYDTLKKYEILYNAHIGKVELNKKITENKGLKEEIKRLEKIITEKNTELSEMHAKAVAMSIIIKDKGQRLYEQRKLIKELEATKKND